jgi:hypothetical protein
MIPYLLVVNNMSSVTFEFFLRIQTGSVSLHDVMVTFVKLPTSDPERKMLNEQHKLKGVRLETY